MRNGLYILIILLVFSCSKDDNNAMPIPTVNGQIELVKTYGGSKNDVAQAIVATADNGYAVLGYTQSADGDITSKTTEDFDYWLLKFDQNNNLLWTKTYGGTDNDRGFSLVQTADQGYAILGFTYSNNVDVTQNNGLQDYWIAKLNANGDLQWQKSFGYSGADYGTNIIQTLDGGYLLNGVLDVTASGGLGNTFRLNQRHAGGDYWTIKLDASGNIMWSRYFGGSFTDTPQQALEINDGYLIIGSSDSQDVDITNNKGSYDTWVVKIDFNGNLVWEQSYGGEEIDEGRAILPTQDGNFMLISDTRSSDQDVSNNKGVADVWLTKIDNSGAILWEQNYGGSSFDVPRAAINTFDENIVIAGSSRSLDGDVSTNQGQNDAWVFQTDTTGNLIWQHAIGGSAIDFLYDIVQLNNGKIIAVGESSSNNGDIIENKGFSDLLIITIN